MLTLCERYFDMKACSFSKVHGCEGYASLGRGWLLDSQQYDQSEQQDRERANLFWINHVISEIPSQLLYSDTEAQIARGACDFSNERNRICTSSFYCRNVPGEIRDTLENFLLMGCQRVFQKVIKVQIQTLALMSSPVLQLSGQLEKGA